MQKGFIGQALLTVILGVMFFSALYRTYVSAPAAFPAPYTLMVSPGQNVADISQQMKNDGVIRSARVLELFMRAIGADKNLSEGQYSFERPMSAIAIGMRISGNEFGISKQKVTFPEGYTNADITAHLKKVFPEFDTTQFAALTKDKQGYLFPDTYSFFGTPLPSKVLQTIEENYEKKIGPLRDKIAKSRYVESEIIIMASVIEKEAKGENDRAVIAGILWNRLHNGMLLQVDAAPATYKTKGLPARPISNPGLAAIKAAMDPTESNYVYYLHDSSGNIHYASTYKEHQQNINTYLK